MQSTTTTFPLLTCSVTGCGAPAFAVTESGLMACYDCLAELDGEYVSLGTVLRETLTGLLVRGILWLS